MLAKCPTYLILLYLNITMQEYLQAEVFTFTVVCHCKVYYYHTELEDASVPPQRLAQPPYCYD